MSFLLAFIISIIGVIPMLIFRKTAAAVITVIISILANWFIIWSFLPSMVWPLFGYYGMMVCILWLISAIVACFDSSRDEFHPNFSLAFPVIGFAIIIITAMYGGSLFHSDEYARMIGDVEERIWTQDVQPKNPEDIRMVTKELAEWLADKQLGDAPGALGSQFHVSKDHMTLQIVNGQLWYVAPFEFNGFWEWSSAKVSPGYVMVDAEDPRFPVQIKLNHKFVYMNEACFGNNLPRYLWNNGYRGIGLCDFSFEVDDSLQPYWVITIFEPTISFWGPKVRGVLVVNPTTGEKTEYAIGNIPEWIDRVIPKDFVQTYVDDMGQYSISWWNSFLGKKDIIEGETPSINYGSDGRPYWVTTLTSTAAADESMVGLIYTDSRTGNSIRYKAKGGTEAGVIQAVNNKVAYKNQHGSGPVLYNIYGTMASIVPLLGENHSFLGVAIVEVDKMMVAEGEDQYDALRKYQELLASSGHQIAAELAHENETITGIVQRFASENKNSETHYILLLQDGEQLFAGASGLSPKLPITKVGDTVVIQYIDTPESIVPMMGFDNTSVQIVVSKSQQAVNETNLEKRAHITTQRENETARGTVQNMSDEELKKLLEAQKGDKK